MQKKGEQSIGEILQEFLNFKHLESVIFEEQIAQIWQETLGDAITKETAKIKLSGGCLYIELRSPALKNEIMMRRTAIAKAINEKLGVEVIKSIYVR